MTQLLLWLWLSLWVVAVPLIIITVGGTLVSIDHKRKPIEDPKTLGDLQEADARFRFRVGFYIILVFDCILCSGLYALWPAV